MGCGVSKKYAMRFSAKAEDCTAALTPSGEVDEPVSIDQQPTAIAVSEPCSPLSPSGTLAQIHDDNLACVWMGGFASNEQFLPSGIDDTVGVGDVRSVAVQKFGANEVTEGPVRFGGKADREQAPGPSKT